MKKSTAVFCSFLIAATVFYFVHPGHKDNITREYDAFVPCKHQLVFDFEPNVSEFNVSMDELRASARNLDSLLFIKPEINNYSSTISYFLLIRDSGGITVCKKSKQLLGSLPICFFRGGYYYSIPNSLKLDCQKQKVRLELSYDPLTFELLLLHFALFLFCHFILTTLSQKKNPRSKK